MPRKTIKVVERKLGKEQALGLSYGGKIEIDPRQDAKRRLSTTCHEILHEAFPEMSEKQVLRAEKIFLQVLWDCGYRQIRK
jgi:hypothetical protein